jgi:hypothetical protein
MVTLDTELLAWLCVVFLAALNVYQQISYNGIKRGESTEKSFGPKNRPVTPKRRHGGTLLPTNGEGSDEQANESVVGHRRARHRKIGKRGRRQGRRLPASTSLSNERR